MTYGNIQSKIIFGKKFKTKMDLNLWFEAGIYCFMLMEIFIYLEAFTILQDNLTIYSLITYLKVNGLCYKKILP